MAADVRGLLPVQPIRTSLRRRGLSRAPAHPPLVHAPRVRVSDAFSLLGPGTNDNQRAALYVNQLLMGLNSLLIVDTNVSLYFVGSNNWTAANFVLLGDAELHQIVV